MLNTKEHVIKQEKHSDANTPINKKSVILRKKSSGNINEI